MIALMFDTASFVDGITARRADFIETLDAGFEAAGEAVADEFRMDVSGRKPDDTGLNIRTGTLLSSIETFLQRSPDGVTSAVFNRNADYWYYHEIGAGNNPKRLDWGNFWETEAERLYASAVDEALGRIAA